MVGQYSSWRVEKNCEKPNPTIFATSIRIIKQVSFQIPCAHLIMISGPGVISLLLSSSLSSALVSSDVRSLSVSNITSPSNSSWSHFRTRRNFTEFSVYYKENEYVSVEMLPTQRFEHNWKPFLQDDFTFSLPAVCPTPSPS